MARSKRINLACSPAEADLFRAQAAKQGVRTSVWLRDCALAVLGHPTSKDAATVKPGAVFGRLTVESTEPMARPRARAGRFAVCRCSCGDVARVSPASLRSGKTKSCGCLRSEASRERMMALDRTAKTG